MPEMCIRDRSLVEAAQDLGASTTKTLVRVLIPMSVPGISTGITMVFVPAVSTFVISRKMCIRDSSNGTNNTEHHHRNVINHL